MRPARQPPVTVTGEHHGLPYSKGLLAASITAAGLDPITAYQVAADLEEELLARGKSEVTSTEVREMVANMLASIHEKHASNYLKWQAVEQLEVPLIVLIGGAAGTGKSTVATQLAARLGITRVISTDAIREVLRAVFSKDLIPALYMSSFEADKGMRVPLPDPAEQLQVGFQEQVAAVSVGIKALIARALEEGTDIIVEGAHVVPGFLEGWEDEFREAVIVPVVITISDEKAHRSNFEARGFDARARRPRDRYLKSFAKIRAVQEYITGLAEARGVPVLEIGELESTLQEIAGQVVARALERAESREDVKAFLPDDFMATKEGDVLPKGKRRGWGVVTARKQ